MKRARSQLGEPSLPSSGVWAASSFGSQPAGIAGKPDAMERSHAPPVGSQTFIIEEEDGEELNANRFACPGLQLPTLHIKIDSPNELQQLQAQLTSRKIAPLPKKKTTAPTNAMSSPPEHFEWTHPSPFDSSWEAEYVAERESAFQQAPLQHPKLDNSGKPFGALRRIYLEDSEVVLAEQTIQEERLLAVQKDTSPRVDAPVL
ncbi:hypothetical protein DL93DRAFT_2231732 [Clavulina sp. PMI_390]|nr:hypothetical protein DL93DRAFT_2231732 [Clavulina sp. PMI_390]